jgi:hypothetical protein
MAYLQGRAGGVRGVAPTTSGSSVSWLAGQLAAREREIAKLEARVRKLETAGNLQTSAPALTGGNWKLVDSGGVLGALYVPDGTITELAPG